MLSSSKSKRLITVSGDIRHLRTCCRETSKGSSIINKSLTRTNQLSSQRKLDTLTALPQLSTGGIQLTGDNPTQLGQQIAQSVYGYIGHE